MRRRSREAKTLRRLQLNIEDPLKSGSGVYVSDKRGTRLRKFSDPGGTALHEWIREDLGGSDVAVNSSDNVYLPAIRKYNEYAGNLSLEWTFGGYDTGTAGA